MVGAPRQLSRRALLGGGAAGLVTALSGCAGGALSSDPHQLVLWYWARSLNSRFLKRGAVGIPGSPGYRVRSDLSGNSTWDTRLRTTLAGRAYVPDLVMINSNVSLYFPDEELFVDLKRYASEAEQKRYYDWKWALGTTPTGRQCFWPVDTGPTGFYYRADLYQKAGLPSDPDEVASAIHTWDDLLALGKKVRSKLDAASFANSSIVFNQYVFASTERYFDRHDHPIYEDRSGTIRKAWDLAVEAIGAKLTADLQSDSDKNAGWTSGKVPSHIEGAWWSQVLKDTAPDSSGKWRVTKQPERAGNSGGSFLAVPSTCKNPRAAYEFISWMMSPENQATTFNDIQLIPSTPASFTGGTMRNPGKYFGPQNPLDVFSTLAKSVPTSYISTYESEVTAFVTEISNVEAGKDPKRAWQDAVDVTNRALAKRGVDA